MGIRDRLARLEGDEARLCEGSASPCQRWPIRTVEVTRRIYEDGSEDWQRPPRADKRKPLCEQCPYGPGGKKQPIRTIKIVRTVRARERS